MTRLKNIAQSIIGAIAWPFMLLRSAWAHRKPGNKLGLPNDNQLNENPRKSPK